MSELYCQSELQQLLNNNDIDVCTLNETWLKSSNKNRFKLKEYCCESSEQKSTSRGGGVGVAIGNHLKYCCRNDLENIHTTLELCIVEIFGIAKKILIVSLYRPPNVMVVTL